MSRPAKPMKPLTEEQKALAEQWWGLAIKRTNQWAKTYPEFADDIEGAAMFGLCKAAGQFDPSRGLKFATFAWIAIGRSIQSEIEERLLCHKGRRRPSSDRVREVQIEEEIMIASPPDPNRDRLEQLDEFNAWLKPLRSRQRKVLRALCLKGKTRLEVAKDLGVTPERIRQILVEAREILEAKRMTA